MLINKAAEGNVNVRNLVQTIAQHLALAFWEAINSILTATNQEQLTYIWLKSRSARGASIHPAFITNGPIIIHKY